MGMSTSWVCVRGKTIEQVLMLLREETAFEMRNGRKIWEISHDSQIALDHLDFDGTVPDCFDEIRSAAEERMKPRGGNLFGVPVDVCKEMTGYHQSLHPLKTVYVPIPFL